MEFQPLSLHQGIDSLPVCEGSEEPAQDERVKASPHFSGLVY